ncbi:MAG: ParB N-terminal domain-containing protein [Acidobacteria bacterium]|nr:ParB N-terminal domain-containing protein [Acidobacteriota bacterium]
MTKKTPTAESLAEEYPWIAEDLRPLAVPIDILVADPDNERAHDAANIGAIVGSLKVHGQVNPLVANRRNNEVVIGNGRLAAAAKLGWTHVAVVWKDLSKSQQRVLRIADNRSSDMACWDDELLAVHLNELLVEAETDEDTRALADALLLQDLVAEPEPEEEPEEHGPGGPPSSTYQIIVECDDAKQRRVLAAKLTKQGLRCHAVTWKG